MERPLLRRYAPHLIALVALVALAIVSGLLWMERKNRFPALEPGSYAGKIYGLFPEDGDTPTAFFMEQLQGEDALLISVVHDKWEPRILAGLNHEGHTEAILPITVEGPGSTFRFIGSHVEKRIYSGTVSDIERKRQGRWELYGIDRRGDAIPQPVQDQLKLWLKLKEELSNTEQQLTDAQARLPQEKQEIEKLNNVLSEGVKLRSTADEKFAEVQKELEKLQEELKQKQARAKALEQKLELSQQVTGMGRLVLLSRQSIDREGRWIESMLRAGQETSAPEVDAAVAEGERALALREQIERERALINDLTARRAAQ